MRSFLCVLVLLVVVNVGRGQCCPCVAAPAPAMYGSPAAIGHTFTVPPGYTVYLLPQYIEFPPAPAYPSAGVMESRSYYSPGSAAPFSQPYYSPPSAPRIAAGRTVIRQRGGCVNGVCPR